MSVTYPDLTYSQLLQDPTVSPSIGFIDINYYLNEYFGANPNDDDLLTRMIIRASEDLDALTGYQITDISEYDAIVKNLIYKATAAQTEYYVLNGENYNEVQTDSVSIGKYSESGSKVSGKIKLCARARMFLEQSGLMFRGENYGCYS